MPLELAGVEAKLMRAQEHFECLRRDVTEKVRTCTYSIRHVRNNDSTDLSLRIQTNGFGFPFLWWSLIVGDFVNNLRSALDHLIYLIAVYESGQDPPPKKSKLAFIIEDQWDDFKRRAESCMGDLSTKAWTAVESVQPYHRVNLYIPSPLSILKDFSNTDKHRTIRLAAVTPALWDFNFTEPLSPTVIREYRQCHDDLEDGAEVAGVRSSQPEPALTSLGQLGVEVTIWHGALPTRTDPGADRSEVLLMCQILMREVREVIQQIVSVYI
jgi:hypothetical protein